MTLSDLDGLLNEALALVSERWPGRLTVSELHPPIPVTNARRTISWLRWWKSCSVRKPTW